MIEFHFISVIMPLYNGEAYVDQAVESVIAQTYTNWELLIVDDGSTDKSWQKAQEWANRDSRIRALQHSDAKNLGVSATRNLAISHAKGEYLALLDCDDKWLSNKLAIQVNVLLKHPEVALVYSKAEVIDEQNCVLWQHFDKIPKLERPLIFGSGIPGVPILDFKEVITNEFWLPASSVLMSRISVNQSGNFDETLKYQVEDSLLFLQIAENKPIYFVNDILVQYRVHKNQWNAKLNFILKWKSLFTCYSILLNKVSPHNYLYVSIVIVDRVFRRFLQQCLKNGRKKHFTSLLRSLYSIYSCKYILKQYKIKAFRMSVAAMRK